MERLQLNNRAPAILLIEKDAVTLEMYQRELSLSFTVFAFTQIDSVPELLASRDIQALVIEPEIDNGQGWKLIDSLQASFPNRPIPVIVCSTRDASRAAPGPEVARYLTKPVLPKTLRKGTLDVLGSKELRGKFS